MYLCIQTENIAENVVVAAFVMMFVIVNVVNKYPMSLWHSFVVFIHLKMLTNTCTHRPTHIHKYICSLYFHHLQVQQIYLLYLYLWAYVYVCRLVNRISYLCRFVCDHYILKILYHQLIYHLNIIHHFQLCVKEKQS